MVALLGCGWPNHKTYKWSDTRTLMEYGIANYERCELDKIPLEKEWVRPIPVMDAKRGGLNAAVAAEVVATKGSGKSSFLKKGSEQVEVVCEVEKELAAPVKKGDKVGKILYQLNGETLWERELVLTQDYEKTDFRWYFLQAVKAVIF